VHPSLLHSFFFFAPCLAVFFPGRSIDASSSYSEEDLFRVEVRRPVDEVFICPFSSTAGGGGFAVLLDL